MVLEILKDVRNIIDDKITRIEKFEKWACRCPHIPMYCVSFSHSSIQGI